MGFTLYITSIRKFNGGEIIDIIIMSSSLYAALTPISFSVNHKRINKKYSSAHCLPSYCIGIYDFTTFLSARKCSVYDEKYVLFFFN